MTRRTTYDEIKLPVDQQSQITALLEQWTSGDRSRMDELIPLVETGLRRIAARHMRREAPNHILQPTALVNEAYLKLIQQDATSWRSRTHFFAIAAKLMRHILVDGARGRDSQKRGGGIPHVSLDHVFAHAVAGSGTNILALDEALSRLAEMDQRKAKVVELRCVGGLEMTEIAEVLSVSVKTVTRDWRLAKTWLRRELERPLPECARTAGQR